MLNVEYAQLSRDSRDRESESCFASIVPRTTEHRRTHGWLFAVGDEVGNEKDAANSLAFVLRDIAAAFSSSSPYELHRALLPRVIQQTNAKLLQTGSENNSPIALLTCALRSDCAVVCHVGDLRCYLIRRGHAELLTRDHTVVNDSRRLGSIPDRDSARTSERQHLTRSIGTDTFVAVDVTERQITSGDVLLACSHGFYSGVREVDMELIISDNRDLRSAARELIAAAAEGKRSSGTISVQLMRIGESVDTRTKA